MGHHMKALAGVYGVDEMLQLLSIDSFEGRGYACIVKDDGSVAVRPEDQTAISGEYNIVSALESQNADDEEPVHVLRAGLKKGGSKASFLRSTTASVRISAIRLWA